MTFLHHPLDYPGRFHMESKIFFFLVKENEDLYLLHPNLPAMYHTTSYLPFKFAK
jgi:hypothetical protein